MSWTPCFMIKETDYQTHLSFFKKWEEEGNECWVDKKSKDCFGKKVRLFGTSISDDAYSLHKYFVKEKIEHIITDEGGHCGCKVKG